jgi:DNA-directed RNA polymerase I and III subunit RPAC2
VREDDVDVGALVKQTLAARGFNDGVEVDEDQVMAE